MKPPVARKLAVRHTKLVCLTASFLATDGFKFNNFNSCLFKYTSVAAFNIYSELREDAAKRGGWRPFVK